MSNLKARALGAASSLAIMASTLAPSAFAETRIEITGNGRDSDNVIHLDISKFLSLDQSNNSNITNDVRVEANTGDNSVSGNTNGDSSTETGDVTTDVDISNAANLNIASIGSCECENDIRALIHDNGRDSNNTIHFTSESVVDVNQNNDSDIDNNVSVDANTGGNESEGNNEGHKDYDHNDYDRDYDSDKYDHEKDHDYDKDRGSNDYKKYSGSNYDRDHEYDYDKKDHKYSQGNYNHDSWWKKNQGNNHDWWKNNNDHDWKSNNWWNNHNDWWKKYDNNRNYNSGGDVEVTTGDVVSRILIKNMANANFFSL